ncbi:hypothetical protein RB213_004205 [Colletotrichum asianum]|nr:hypothetical protein GQ607_011974 [Colletotrichum asianum]
MSAASARALPGPKQTLRAAAPFFALGFFPVADAM